MPKENNKMQVDIENLFKQNVNDLLSIKELYKRIEELGEKITQIKYIDNTLVNKLKKEYEKLNKIILDENIQVKLTNDVETINSQIQTFNSHLDTITNLGYNNSSIDTMKDRFEGHYVSVLDFGADQSGNSDSSQSFQDCIDYCFTQNKVMFIPQGIYLITNTLELPYSVTIVGDNYMNDYYTSSVKKSTLINTKCDVVFKPKDASNTQVVLTFKNIFFKNSYTLESTLFGENINIRASLLTKLLIANYDYVIKGTLSHASIIEKNHIYAIKKSFIEGTLIDSIITFNYINGKPENNAICFNISNSTMSDICENYIDFFKIAFNFSKYIQTTGIKDNRIDYCYIGITANNLNYLNISGNIFRYINKNNISKFPNADDDMKNSNKWCCIKSINGVNRCVLKGNTISYCDEFFNITGYPCYEFSSLGNVYLNGERNFTWSITKSGNDYGMNNIYIQEMERNLETELPKAKLTGAGIVSYPLQQIIYNNQLLTNIGGVWKDAIGNTVT